MEHFHHLVAQRWTEACRHVGHEPQNLPFTWDYGNDYPHFRKKRGYAVCFFEPDGSIRLLFATKVFRAPQHRQDALVRHEIGHALDFLFGEQLDTVMRGLPQTPERRADAIAECIWGEPLRYDKDMVQSTRFGVTPRPRKLGL